MTRILFVCHGNICRSTMAEFVMKDLVAQEGCAGDFHIESAATHNDMIGAPVHRGTAKVLDELGIDYSKKRARRLHKADAEPGQWDYFIAMDEANVANIKQQLGSSVYNRVHLLLSFAGDNREVADPWYTGDFEVTYRDVLAGCKALLKHLRD